MRERLPSACATLLNSGLPPIGGVVVCLCLLLLIQGKRSPEVVGKRSLCVLPLIVPSSNVSPRRFVARLLLIVCCLFTCLAVGAVAMSAEARAAAAKKVELQEL